MDKERVIGLLDQLSSIVAGKEGTVGKGLVDELQAAIGETKKEVINKEGLALGASLSGLVNMIRLACLPETKLSFTTQEKPVWEELQTLTNKERAEAARGINLF